MDSVDYEVSLDDMEFEHQEASNMRKDDQKVLSTIQEETLLASTREQPPAVHHRREFSFGSGIESIKASPRVLLKSPDTP